MRNSQLLPNPPAVIQFSEATSMAEMIMFAKSQREFKNEEELLHFITHNINNIRHRNGRIYMKIDNDGSLFAHSVSPYSDTFEDNVEPGVKDLISILRKKRYLTYSSCEGHGNSFRRYVGLAFADEDSREIVDQYIKSLKIKGIFTKKFKSVSNQNCELDPKNPKIIEYKDKINPMELEGKTLEQHKQKETAYFNISFHRNYEDYCFLEIVILEEMTVEMKKKQFLKWVWLWFMKKYKWDKITAKLVKALEDKKFPKYKY